MVAIQLYFLYFLLLLCAWCEGRLLIKKIKKHFSSFIVVLLLLLKN